MGSDEQQMQTLILQLDQEDTMTPMAKQAHAETEAFSLRKIAPKASKPKHEIAVAQFNSSY